MTDRQTDRSTDIHYLHIYATSRQMKRVSSYFVTDCKTLFDEVQTFPINWLWWYSKSLPNVQKGGEIHSLKLWEKGVKVMYMRGKIHFESWDQCLFGLNDCRTQIFFSWVQPSCHERSFITWKNLLYHEGTSFHPLKDLNIKP